MLETLRKKENISLEKGKQAEVIAIRHQIMSLSQKKSQNYMILYLAFTGQDKTLQRKNIVMDEIIIQ